MRMRSTLPLGILGLISHGYAQTLLQAISGFSQLSRFTQLMTYNPELAGALLTSNASTLSGASTILVPDNSAFDKISVIYNVSMSNLTVAQLEPYLQYHLLVGEVTTENFTSPRGVTVPTFLTGPTFNNRTAGAALGSSGAVGDPRNGQVVFFQSKPRNSTSKRGQVLEIRQLQNPTVDAQGGLGHMINLTAVDGRWDGGYFQIVDKFLSLPLNCTESIRRWRMNAFRQGLNRTGLGAALDITQNVTCFTPNDDAFLAAGSPEVRGNITALERLIKFHTIVEPLYSNFLADGQTYTTFSNETIRITVRGNDIFVNDAKIINKNVMTNNGLMHVIDKVMSPLNSQDNAAVSATGGSGPLTTRTNAPIGSASATVTVTATPSAGMAAATAVDSKSWLWTMLAMIGGLIV